MNILQVTSYPPFLSPVKPWVMTQTWHHLLFAHWPVTVAYIREFIPPPLTVDTIDGFAWVGIVPFNMSHIRFRGLPYIPGTTRFPEINVRTYVVHNGIPGVFFFSLDTTHPLAVIGARRFLSLPYYQAKIQTSQKNNIFLYRNKRIHRSAYPASFEAEYTPVSDGFYSSASSMEHWLTERYCLYTYDDHYMYRGDIHHTPWTLHHAKAFISENSMLTPLRFPVKQSQPLLHYARKKKVRIFPFVRVASI